MFLLLGTEEIDDDFFLVAHYSNYKPDYSYMCAFVYACINICIHLFLLFLC